MPASGTNFSGVYPMLYAFWDDAGRLDEAAMERQVEHCIAAGAHGVAVLGLVTEGHLLDNAERIAIVRAVGKTINGSVPYSVTISEADADRQLSFAEAAMGAGASWLVLQPPTDRKMSEAELVDHFGRSAERIGGPLGVQNNPEHLLNWLSSDGLATLHQRHPNISILKGEGAVANLAPLIEKTLNTLATFGGHGGIEFLSLMRAGAAGLIAAPDCLPLQVRIYELMCQGTPDAVAEAEAIHGELLPLVVFMNRSIDALLCYGRLFMARRLGLEGSIDRFGKTRPTRFGLEEVDRLFQSLSRSEKRWLSEGG